MSVKKKLKKGLKNMQKNPGKVVKNVLKNTGEGMIKAAEMKSRGGIGIIGDVMKKLGDD